VFAGCSLAWEGGVVIASNDLYWWLGLKFEVEAYVKAGLKFLMEWCDQISRWFSHEQPQG
jgi:hypothetical protein